MADTLKKILFSDLDGTLLDDHKEIGPDTLRAIDEMLEAGHYFAACTGRPLASAKRVAGQYGLDQKGCYIVAYNGGVLYDPVEDEVISYRSIPAAIAKQLLRKASEAGLHAQTYDPADDTVLVLRQTPEMDYYSSHTRLPWRMVEDFQDIVQDPPKLIIASLTDHESLQRFRDSNASWAADSMDSFFSCEQFLEYCPFGVSKGAGLKQLCGHLGIPVSASVAVGDERNDIAMLQVAGIAAVPANAYHEVCGYADYRCTKDNDHGAVGEIIRKFILS